MQWNSEAYIKQYDIASDLTDKGILIALNQAHSLTNEAREAYEDVLRERGWEDSQISRGKERERLFKTADYRSTR